LRFLKITKASDPDNFLPPFVGVMEIILNSGGNIGAS